jgi:hypothetical protein
MLSNSGAAHLLQARGVTPLLRYQDADEHVVVAIGVVRHQVAGIRGKATKRPSAESTE